MYSYQSFWNDIHDLEFDIISGYSAYTQRISCLNGCN